MLGKTKKRIREDSGVGIKPISIFGTRRLVRYAIRHAIETGTETITAGLLDTLTVSPADLPGLDPDLKPLILDDAISTRLCR